jgi:hypothetical protein
MRMTAVFLNRHRQFIHNVTSHRKTRGKRGGETSLAEALPSQQSDRQPAIRLEMQANPICGWLIVGTAVIAATDRFLSGVAVPPEDTSKGNNGRHADAQQRH